MKITELRIDRTKRTGDYENLKLGFTVLIEDDEDAAESIAKTQRLLDWEINKSERVPRYEKYKMQIADGSLNGKRETAERYIEQFEKLATEFAPELIITGPAEPGRLQSTWNNANTKI